MIDVKSFKPRTTSAPTAEEIYRKPEDAPSPRWPAAIVLALAAIAIYVKSLFPSLAKSDLGSPAGKQEEEEAGGGRPRQLAEAEAEDETGSLPKDEEHVLGSGAPGPAVGGIADFMGIDSPAIDYELLPLRPTPSSIDADFTYQRPSNDNRTNASFDNTSVGLSGVGAVGSQGFEGIKVPNPVVIDSRGSSYDPPAPGGTDDDGDAGPPDQEPGPTPERNRAPVLRGPLVLADTGICTSVLITVAALLSGASDADGDTLSITNLRTSSGTLTPVEGGWLFKATPGYYGPVSLSYEISDGALSVVQTASFSVVEFTEINGTPGDDTLTGTECADRIDGGDGNDTIDARGGNDIVYGSGGADLIRGGAGHDLIYAGRGDDVVYGGSGNDTIHGGDGNDSLHGEDGDDVIHGDAGDDLITGGAGNDQLAGGAGNDEIHGDSGDDTIDGGDGDDLACGDDGADAIDGGAGNDTLSGGAGNDHISGGDGNDALSGGDGNDIMDGGDGDDDIDGGDGQNLIFTGSGNNRVSAGDGNNAVTGGGGQDQVRLGAGSDVVHLGGGDDMVAAGAGDDRLFGEDGYDALFGEDGDDVVSGGEGEDYLAGAAGSDVMEGGGGDDIIDGGDGDDEIDGGAGDDVILAGEGCDVAEGGDGNDVMLGDAGDDRLDGGEGDDVIDGGAGDDTVSGGEGNDTLDGGIGTDIVKAGDGTDWIIVALDGENDCYDGGEGFDTLDFSAATVGVEIDLKAGTAIGIEIGKDTIVNLDAIIGGSGDDEFTVGAKAMSLTGGAGDDTFTFDVTCDDEERELIHEILDLEAGDRIIVQEYRIGTEEGDCDEEPEDARFGTAYGDNEDGSERPFRFRIEKVGDDDYTYVDVYITQTDEKDFTIEILGNHRLYYT